MGGTQTTTVCFSVVQEGRWISQKNYSSACITSWALPPQQDHMGETIYTRGMARSLLLCSIVEFESLPRVLSLSLSLYLFLSLSLTPSLCFSLSFFLSRSVYFSIGRGISLLPHLSSLFNNTSLCFYSNCLPALYTISL